MTDAPLVVVGGGCAGLSLAVALIDEGWDRPLVVLERRTAHVRDRTWCFWDTGDVPWSDRATASWDRWRIGDAVQHAATHPYLHLPADRFHDAALRRLRRARGVEVRLGVRVTAMTEHADGVRLRTSEGPLDAARVVDCRGAAHPAVREALRTGLTQRFLGQVVRTDRPRFDPAEATLMAFHGDHPRELRFVYTLPLSEREALVEDTSFAWHETPAAARRRAIAATVGVPFDVAFEERGVIPMSPVAAQQTARVWTAGLPAGAARPSSGYAFVRIQRQTAALARALCDGRRTPPSHADARRDALDAVFLRALAEDPPSFAEHLTTLAHGVEGDVLARFMNDASTAADELRVMAALPPGPFLRAAVTPGGASPPGPTDAAPARARSGPSPAPGPAR